MCCLPTDAYTPWAAAKGHLKVTQATCPIECLVDCNVMIVLWFIEEWNHLQEHGQFVPVGRLGPILSPAYRMLLCVCLRPNFLYEIRLHTESWLFFKGNPAVILFPVQIRRVTKAGS